MKNKISILFCSLLLSLPISACNNGNKVDETTVKVITNQLSKTFNSKYFSYSFNIDDYVTLNSEVNKQKAVNALLFTINRSKNAYLSFDKTDYPIMGCDDHENFYKHLKLDDFKLVNIGSGETDTSDVTSLDLAHKIVNKDNKSYDVTFISVCDSTYLDSWNSNFDVGYDGESYYEKTGEHLEWTNKENHKGFDVAANRCIDTIKDYISSHNNENSQQILHFFGHSRGGALANILAQKFIEEDYAVDAFAFASPCTTTSSHAKDSKYNTIINIFNTNDIVTNALSEEIGFTRYGQDVRFAINDYKSQFEEYNIDTVLPNTNVTPFINALNTLETSRSDFYVIDDKYTVDLAKTADTEEEINQYINEIKDTFNNATTYLLNFISFDVINNGDNYSLKVTTCPGLLMAWLGYTCANDFANMSDLVSGNSSFNPFLNVFLKISGLRIADFLKLNPFYVYYAHYFYAYYTYVNIM